MSKSADKMMTIRFSKKIYKLDAIKRAAKDYSAHAGIRLSEEGEFIKVSMSGIPSSDAAELRGEFCNYALSLMREL